LSIFAVSVSAAESEAKVKPEAAVTSLPQLPGEIQDALQDRRFAVAIKLVDAELAKAGRANADYLLYLKGRAQTELRLYDPAVATFRKIVGDHPQSAWAARARFGEADVYIRQRNYQSAGDIYKLEATRLLSAGRRDELAAIYLEFA